MNSIIHFLQAHPTSSILVSYYIVSAFVGSLPAPQQTSGLFYQFAFKFSNTLAGNLTRAFSAKLGAATQSAEQKP